MKKRLDQVLVERGLAASRTQAQAMIMAGLVTTEGRVLDKAGMPVDPGAQLEVKNKPRYASRGGDKLASVAAHLDVDFTEKAVLDVGSSTGGFTDFALQNGAVKVYAVDVGTGQLDWKLRNDPRVVVMEQTDIRQAKLPEQADAAVVDVSFISLTKILERIAALLKPDGLILAMAKPQFEAGKEIADRFRGVIKDQQVRNEVLSGLEDWLTQRFEIIGQADSALPGAEGNIERFYLLRAKH